MALELIKKGLMLSTALPFFLFLGGGAMAADTGVTLTDTVTAALGYSPRLKVLQSNQKAIGYERDRARGGYYPQIDVAFGYGTEAHSDQLTRIRGNQDDFYSRMEASIRLSQLLYDGKETSSLVAIEEARLDSAGYRTFGNAEALALDAIIAHMEIYRNKELVRLAQNNVNDHLSILEMLDERQEAGAGSIADVDQTQARLARAYASLAATKTALKTAEANYQRLAGKLPGDVEFFVVPPSILPASLDEAISQTMDNNPRVLASTANIDEAESRVDLSKANFLPKIYGELSSSYEDQVESSATYEQNHQAMVRLRWNIFNGGSDIADRRAAMTRKAQAVANRNDQRDLAIEEARATWADLASARQRVASFGDAVIYDRKTLDSYRKQFDVGQRTLLDVLDARNELFQSSGLLVTARTNYVIASERLLALTGRLNDSLQVDSSLYANTIGPK